RSIHVEKCRRRSGGPLLSAQGRVGRGRELDDGTGAPDPLCCLGRRQEKGDVDVPSPVVSSGPGTWMIDTLERLMTRQSSVSRRGIRGWRLSVGWVSRRGPAPKPRLSVAGR